MSLPASAQAARDRRAARQQASQMRSDMRPTKITASGYSGSSRDTAMRSPADSISKGMGATAPNAIDAYKTNTMAIQKRNAEMQKLKNPGTRVDYRGTSYGATV
jgi:hypothetical protein